MKMISLVLSSIIINTFKLIVLAFEKILRQIRNYVQ